MPNSDVTVNVAWEFDNSPQGEEGGDDENNTAGTDAADKATGQQQSQAAASYSSAAPLRVSSAPNTGYRDETPLYIIMAAGAAAGITICGIFTWRKKKVI